MKKPPIRVKAGQLEFLKVNATQRDWRDVYHWILSLRWAQFSALVLGVYLLLNLIFAAFYSAGAPCIAEVSPGSFWEAFFFSVETWATVGYGHMYPMTPYGHAVVTIELISGMFWMAMITGLIFVRFSRPIARIVFSDSMVIAPFDGKPTLMLRVANLRHQAMVEAEFRLMLLRDEQIMEGETVRRFYPLKLTFERLIMFPVALTLRHVIDEQSPIYGLSAEDLQRSDCRFMASVVCVDTVIPAPLQCQQDYHWRDVRFGERFVEIYTDLEDGRLVVDYGRLHETEPVTGSQ